MTDERPAWPSPQSRTLTTTLVPLLKIIVGKIAIKPESSGKKIKFAPKEQTR